MIIEVTRFLPFFLMFFLSFPEFLQAQADTVSAVEIQYDAGERRDPFTPLIGPDGILSLKGGSRKSSEFEIEGIMVDSGGDSAVIIGGEVYRAGETINDALIVQIFRDRILLAQEDEEKTIWLREEHATT